MLVLWIDDDGPERFLYETTLTRRRLKAEFHFAMTVQTAKSKLADRTCNYDFIILDMLLPRDVDTPSLEIAGWKLLQSIREGDLPVSLGRPEIASIPAAIVSAFADDEILARLGKPPYEDVSFLSKPVYSEDLVRLLSRAMR